MKNQNPKKVASTYSNFLSMYKSIKNADCKDLQLHKQRVLNLINGRNKEFAAIAPIKTWLSCLKDETFIPRTSKAGNYSIFFTLQALLRVVVK